MGNPLYVFGIEILLQDHADPVTAAAAIGLYNINSALSANSAAGSRHVTVADGTVLTDGEVVTVTDTNGSESATIAAVTGNSIAFKTALTNAYTTAATATVHANSRFRWLQQAITGVTGWSATMLTPKGISPWTRQIDLKRGGGIATPGTCTATVKNTSKFWDSLQDKVIYLNGLVFNVWEFQGTVKTRQWWGICEKPDWTSKMYKIPAKGGYNKRKSNLSTLITQAQYPDASGDDVIGKAVPVTFGEYKPKFDVYGNIDYDSYAKYLRIANKVDAFNSEDGVVSRTPVGDNFEVELSPGEQGLFPVVGNDGDTPPVSYDIKLANDAIWYRFGTQLTSGTYSVTFFDDQYIHVLEGTGEDAYRSIDYAWVDIDTDSTVVIAAVSDYFEEDLAGNATATAEDNSWVSIEEISRQYQCDVWPCENYLGRTGFTSFFPVDDGFDLYAYDTDAAGKATVTGAAETVTVPIFEKPLSYLRLPQYAYEDSGSGDKNKLDIDVSLFNGSPDKMDSYLIMPVLNFRAETIDSIAANWGLGGSRIPGYPGLYSSGAAGPQTLSVDSGSVAAVTDGVSTTNVQYTMTTNDALNGYLTHVFEFPEFPKHFTFDTAYLGVKCTVETDNAGIFYTQWRRFFGSAKTIKAPAYNFTSGLPYRYENMPDFYFSDAPNSRNEFFYKEVTNENQGTELVTAGRDQWEISDIGNEEIYNSMIQGSLIFLATGLVTPTVTKVNLYEVAIIFRKEVSIKKAIYGPMRGRIFDDTWDGRKVSADMITDPIEVMEHACRLQNWGESSTVPTGGWGKAYAEGARIAYTGRGSFSTPFFDANISAVLDLNPTNQIQTEQKAGSDVIKKSLCRDFFLANWADKDGYERVARIVKSETTPSDTVTLADIIDRKSINITEPNPGDVYCAPFVRYQKNFASGEYQKSYRITNPDAETFDADYVDGLLGDSAEEFWGRCKTLWERIGFITEPPPNLTDLDWANGEDGDRIAKEYLTEWIDWMFNPAISFKVHYLKAGAWEEAHKFVLQLPHQTDDTQIECIVTKMRVDPNPPYPVTVGAIMLRETIPEQYFIADTMTAFGDSSDWLDKMTEYGNDNDKVDQS